MSRTYLSILTKDEFIQEKTKFAIQSSAYRLGYAGQNENELIKFLKNYVLGDHFVFIKPFKNIYKSHQETFYAVFAKSM